MGCGCQKRPKPGTKLPSTPLQRIDEAAQKPVPSGLKVFYIFCATCNVVITKRTDAQKIYNYHCTTCGNRTVYFDRPPTAKKLSMFRQRMLGE